MGNEILLARMAMMTGKGSLGQEQVILSNYGC